MSTAYWISSWINPFHHKNEWLSSAVAEGNIELVKTTLAQGADPNFVHNEFGYCNYENNLPVLYIAVENRHFEIAKTLLESGANANDKAILGNIYSQWTRYFDEAETALIPAVRNNDAEMVNLLLSYGAKTNVTNINNQPLHEAAVKNNVEIADLLIKNGADVNQAIVTRIFGENGHYDHKTFNTPLFYANSLEMVKLLLENGAKIAGSEYIEYSYSDQHWVPPAMIHAINKGDFAKVQLLTEAGADIDALKADPHFEEMIIDLLKTKQNSMIDWAISLDGPTRLNMSEAHLAALKGDIKALISLNNSHVDINVPDKLGYTPFHYTYFMNAETEQKSQKIVQETLIKMGADLHAPSCIAGHVGEPVWKTIDHDLRQMTNESYQIKTFQEGYSIQYDDKLNSLTVEKISSKSEADLLKELPCCSQSLRLSDVVNTSDGIAGLENSTMPLSHHVQSMHLTPVQLPQMQELIVHTEY